MHRQGRVYLKSVHGSILIFGNDPWLNDLFPRERSHFLGDQKNFDSSSFSHVTQEFVCKQTVISFGVLLVLQCSSFLRCWHSLANSIWIKFVSLSSEISFKIAVRTDVCSFKVAVLCFTRALSGAKWLEDERERSWRWRARERSRAFLQDRSLTELAHGSLTQFILNWAEAPPSPLLAVPNVTAHPSTASVPTSFDVAPHYNFPQCPLKG